MSGGVFISYRRDDSAGWTGRIYDRAAQRLGSNQVFLDVEVISPGEDFEAAIEAILDEVETVLVVIGPSWMSSQDDSAVSRLEDPADHVRREIEGALRRECRVVPVLVGGAEMPAGAELPEEIRPLVGRNAVPLSDLYFADDMERLLEAIRPTSEDHHPSNDSAVSSTSDVPTNLPRELTPFVGRAEELKDLGALLQEHRLVTVTGPGGSGKTRLALEVVRNLTDAYPDGVWLVELASLREPDLIPAEVALAIGLELSTDQATNFLSRALSDQTTLIILDNCEHLLADTSSLASKLVGAAPGLSILATSREPLKVAGQTVFVIPPMSTPPEGAEAADLASFDATKLFLERAAPTRRSTIPDDWIGPIAELSKKLDGMPLAIELAAARTNSLAPQAILERLEHRFRLFEDSSSDVPERHRTLKATIDWSFELLPESERILFGRLGAFRSGFNLDAAEEVCGSEPLSQPLVFEHLGHLVDKSLVQAEPRPRGIRYRMLDTINHYAYEKLAESRESEVTAERHARHFARLANQARLHLPGQHEETWIALLDDDLDNLRQAMRWALESADHRLAQHIVGSLHRYFLFTYRTAEGRQWAEQALDASDQPTPERARALLAAAAWGNSPTYAKEALTLAKSLELDDVLAGFLYDPSLSRRAFGDKWTEAENIYQTNLEAALMDGDRARIAHSLLSLAYFALSRSDYSSAMDDARRALEEAKQAGSIRIMLWARVCMFNISRLAGNPTQAKASIEEIVSQQETLGSEPGLLSYSKMFQATFAIDEERFDKAASLMTEALNDLRALRSPRDEAGHWSWLLAQGARLLNHLNAPSDSAVLEGALDSHIAHEEYVLRPWQAEVFDEIRDQTREALDGASFDLKYDQGRRLSLDEAFKYLEEALNTL